MVAQRKGIIGEWSRAILARAGLLHRADRGRAVGMPPSSAVVAEPIPGSQLGKYVLERLLGRGGNGAVFEATDTLLKRSVAIKVLTADPARDGDEAAGRFLNEARAVARLNHPQVVTIHEIDRQSGVDYIVMELMAQ